MLFAEGDQDIDYSNQYSKFNSKQRKQIVRLQSYFCCHRNISDWEFPYQQLNYRKKSSSFYFSLFSLILYYNTKKLY